MKKGLILFAVFLLVIFIATFRWVPADSVGLYREHNRAVSVDGPTVVPFVAPYSKFEIFSTKEKQCRFAYDKRNPGCFLVENLSFSVEIDYYFEPEGAVKAYENFNRSRNIDQDVAIFVRRVGEENFKQLLEAYDFSCDPAVMVNFTKELEANRSLLYDFYKSLQKQLEPIGVGVRGVHVDPLFKIPDAVVEAVERKISNKAPAEIAKAIDALITEERIRTEEIFYNEVR